MMGEHKRNKNRYRSPKSRKLKTTIIISFAILAIGFGLFLEFIKQANHSLSSLIDPVRTRGSQEAPIQIVEFVDFQCAECARGSLVIDEYLKEFPEGISISLKYFPLGELNSMISAVYAECAARQDKFWYFAKDLFKDQGQWRSILKVKPFLNIIAEDSNINLNELEQCVDGQEAKSVVLQEKRLGESYGVRITPTYFINDEMFVGVEALKSALEGFFKVKIDGDSVLY